MAPARARLLRRVGIAHRRRVLDLGAGYGAVTAELARRCGGTAVALDRDEAALADVASFAGAGRAAGTAERLPFAAGSFDLVFCQCLLMWVGEVETAVSEIYRVLAPGGVLIALEPDYGGLIEHPPQVAVRDLWLAALPRVGADPRLGRKLPGLLAAAGFALQVNLLESLTPPAPSRLDFLRPLPLTAVERERLAEVEMVVARLDAPWFQVAHLPFVLVTAKIP